VEPNSAGRQHRLIGLGYGRSWRRDGLRPGEVASVVVEDKEEITVKTESCRTGKPDKGIKRIGEQR